MSDISRNIYKPLSVAVSVSGGLIAGAVFNQVWKRVSDSEEAPDPKDLTQSTREVMVAAAIQGLILGVTRAALNRTAARGYRAVTHESID